MIDHHLLGIHHLKPGSHQFLWDLGFLGAGVLLVGIGALLIQVKVEKPGTLTP